MTNPMIPFGKYKDQPLEVLAADKPYLDWLLAQSWFKDRYSDLFTVVINNFQEPADTLEHNAMQIKFLDDRYVIDLLAPVVGFANGMVMDKKFECHGWDVFINLYNRNSIEYEEIRRKRSDLLDESDNCNDPLRREEISDEIGKLYFGLKNNEFYIELKPTVSDDFPSVLRQMKSTKLPKCFRKDLRILLLIVGNYTGIGATEEQFVQFMANEGITVIFDR